METRFFAEIKVKFSSIELAAVFFKHEHGLLPMSCYFVICG